MHVKRLCPPNNSSRRAPVWFFIMMCASCLGACEAFDEPGLDTDFDIPRTEAFEKDLSTYNLYEPLSPALTPAQGVHLYEISSELFTDYASKQRLIKLPQGTSATVLDSLSATYPDGTIVAKTFSFPRDLRDPSQGRRVIETRLMIMREGSWNVATYIWNDAQTQAFLSLDATTTPVSWIDADGQERSTTYEIPSEVACITCHQSSEKVALLGLRPRNLNRPVRRDAQTVDQLAHLQAAGVFGDKMPSEIGEVVDSTDSSKSLERRARAYLDVNCSHCHSPNAWEEPADEGLDLRYETSLSDSGILEKRNALGRVLPAGRMPFIGTTMLHEEGVELVLDYLDSL